MAKLDAEDEQLRERLAAHVRRILFERGWRQARLAKELDVTTPTISTILSNRRGVGIDVFAKLHRKMGIDANELLDTDPPERFFNAAFNAEFAIESAAAELDDLSSLDRLPPEVAQRIKQLAADLRRVRRSTAAKP